MPLQDLAGRRQRDSAGFPQEQHGADIPLESGDLTAERRLGDAQLRCGRREAAGFGHGGEVSKLARFHRGRPCLPI
jgi:hypothetical protein